MGAKIAVSALFLDFGIVDAITDKHRDYPASFVILLNLLLLLVRCVPPLGAHAMSTPASKRQVCCFMFLQIINTYSD